MLWHEAARRTPSEGFDEQPVVVEAEAPASDDSLEPIQIGGHEPPKCPQDSEAEIEEGEFSSRRLEQLIIPDDMRDISQESKLQTFLQGQGDAESIRKAQGQFTYIFLYLTSK